NTVQIGGGETLAQRFTEIGTVTADTEANVSTLMEAVIDPDGSGRAKYVLSVTAGGAIAGIVATADGGESSLAFQADTFTFVDPNGDNPIVPLSYADGRWKMTDVYIEKLEVGAVTRSTIDPGAVTNTHRFTASDV